MRPTVALLRECPEILTRAKTYLTLWLEHSSRGVNPDLEEWMLLLENSTSQHFINAGLQSSLCGLLKRKNPEKDPRVFVRP